MLNSSRKISLLVATVSVLASPPSLCTEFISRANLNTPDMSKVKLHPFSPDQLNSIHSNFRKAGEVGFGYLMGYSSGFCLRKGFRIIAFGAGGAFIVIQSLSYSGLIKVNYDGIQKKVETVLDLNKDGKVDAKDAQLAMDKIQEVLGHNMLIGGGFTIGFLVGLRALTTTPSSVSRASNTSSYDTNRLSERWIKNAVKGCASKENALLRVEEVLQDFKQRKKQLLVDIYARLVDLCGSYKDG
eukprot:scaffold654_cov207-Ochromonas_danica.AAC.12